MTGLPPASWAVDPAQASATEVFPGLWRLRIPLGWEQISHVNAYLVERDGGAMLVDCGSSGDPTCAEALRNAIELTGHRPEDIAVVALTHVHSDHCGNVNMVLGLSPAQLWAHPATAHFYDVWRAPTQVAALRRACAMREGVPPERLAIFADVREELNGADGPLPQHKALVNGVRLESSLGDWEVIETPGHAPSHVSLLQRERGLLIAGDIVCIMFVPWLEYGYSDDPFAESMRSLELLQRERSVTLTLAGHGRPIDDLDAVISDHRRGFNQRLEAMREAVAEGQGSAYELCRRAYGPLDDGALAGGFVETLCLLRHLHRRGEVESHREHGLRTYRQTVSSRH